MDNKDFAKKLEKRTRTFAVWVIRLSKQIPSSEEGRVVKNQLTKAGTSIGANYREANRGISKADFKNKIKIAVTEASETQYWLEIITESKMLEWEVVKPVYEECSELVAIFTSILKKLQD